MSILAVLGGAALGLFSADKSAGATSDAAKTAANATLQATKANIAFQQGIYDQTRSDQLPYMMAGQQGLGNLMGADWRPDSPSFQYSGNPQDYLPANHDPNAQQGDTRSAQSFPGGQAPQNPYGTQSGSPTWSQFGSNLWNQFKTGVQAGTTPSQSAPQYLSGYSPEYLARQSPEMLERMGRHPGYALDPYYIGSDRYPGGSGYSQITHQGQPNYNNPYATNNTAGQPQQQQQMVQDPATGKWVPRAGGPTDYMAGSKNALGAYGNMDTTGGMGLKVNTELDENDPIYQWKLKQQQDATDKYLSSRRLSGGGFGAELFADQSMKVASEEVDKQYGRGVDEYNRQYGQQSDLYNRNQNQLWNVFSGQQGIDQFGYNQDINLANMGMGAAGQVAGAGNAMGGNVAQAYNSQATGLSNAAMYGGQGESNLWNFGAGLGGMAFGSGLNNNSGGSDWMANAWGYDNMFGN